MPFHRGIASSPLYSPLMKALRLSAVLLLALLCVPSSFAWGSKGHRIVSRLAAASLPADMPAFLRTPEAINTIEYLGPEPDRWRSRAEPELSAAQAPDHFIDLEYADLIGPLPRERYAYIAALYAYAAAHPDRAFVLRPEKVGFQPYITSEVWERLKSAMRDYRTLSAAHEDTKPVEAAILFYAGWLSHYVADGSQPLHVTIQYNGWTGPNPNGYTTEHHIHSLFESDFINAAINASDVQPLMTPLHPVNNEWDDYLAYLRHSHAQVERVYQIEKAHGFEGAGTPASRQFTAERLAAGASMLRDLIVAAWVKSAEPIPDWHDQHDNSTLKVTGATTTANSATDSVTSGSAPSSAAQPFTGKVYKAGYGVITPVMVSNPKDSYFRQAAKDAHASGRVLVACILDENGVPRNAHIVQSSDHRLDEKALAAVSLYRFRPARTHGQSVAMEINLDMHFEQ